LLSLFDGGWDLNFQGKIYKRYRRILMISLAAILCLSLVAKLGCALGDVSD